MWQQLVKLSKDNPEGLQVQLRKSLTGLILDGRLSTEFPLPSSRDLANMLEVSRSTVTLAYQRLVDEGFLISRERQGYFVNPDLSGSSEASSGTASFYSRDWSSRLKFSVSDQRNIQKRSDWFRYPYPFIFGQVDAELTPVSEWRECWRRAQGVSTITRTSYDLMDQDDKSLIEQLRTRVLPKRGIWCRPENILITLGAQNALALITNLLVKQSDTVGLENPGYPDARNLFSLETDNIAHLDVDGSGLVIDNKLDTCDYIYTTPSFQSPTTATLTAERRDLLLQKAQQHDIVIIEDDYETEAAFGDTPVPSLKSQDEDNKVIYCGSLSKSLAPGLRLGFMVADEALINEARALRRLTIRHPPSVIENTVAYFLELGHYDSHQNRLAKVYRERWQIMAAALDEFFPDSGRRETFGGSSFWVTGPADLDADSLAVEAANAGILIEPGSVHFAGPDPQRNCFRLGFSAIATDKISPGLEVLASLIP